MRCSAPSSSGTSTGCPIDASTLRAVQPIYIARPILVDVADPIEHRTGLEHDIHAAVPLPVLPVEKPKPIAAHAFQHRAPLRVGLPPGRGGDAAGRPVRRRRARRRGRPASLPDLGCLACRRARRRPAPRGNRAALINAAQRAGLEDQRADLARQVRNGFKLGIFGTGAPA